MSAGNGRTELCDYEHEMSVLSQLDDAEKTIEALQQANEQLQAQNKATVEALRKAKQTLHALDIRGGLGYDKHKWIRDALAAIDKIGGRE